MNARSACKINGLNYPAADQIGGRTSTICRSMACTLLKREACPPEEEKKWMKFFPGKTCAYCGGKATHLDHLHPLIIDRFPSGYGTEPANLVPCCTKCNQPKGNLDWEEFMRSSKCAQIVDADGDEETCRKKRIEIIKKFQMEMPPHVVHIDDEIREKWMTMLRGFDKALQDAQKVLIGLKKEMYKDE